MLYARLFMLIMCSLFSGMYCGIERPIVITITSYNNKDWYERNLDSVFSQQYTNYRIIYADDASQDETADLVVNYVHNRGQGHRVTLIRNKEWASQLANHYTGGRQEA